MFIYLGIGLSSEFTQSVFGVQTTQQIDTERLSMPVFDNPLSKRVRGIIDSIQSERTRCMRVRIFLENFDHISKKFHFLQDCACSSTRQARGRLAPFPD